MAIGNSRRSKPPTISHRAGRGRVDDPVAGGLEQGSERVQRQHLPEALGNHLERIQHRAAIEQHGGQDRPDDHGVPEARVERRDDQRHRDGEHQQEQQHDWEKQPRPGRIDSPSEDEYGNHDEVECQVEERGQYDGERDHQPRELRLADHRLLAHERPDRNRGRLGEESEEDEVEQQQDRIVRHVRSDPEHLLKTASRTPKSMSGRASDHR